MPVVVLMASCWALERRRGRISGKTEDHPGLQQPYPKRARAARPRRRRARGHGHDAVPTETDAPHRLAAAGQVDVPKINISQTSGYAPRQLVVRKQQLQVGEFAQLRRYLPAQLVVAEIQLCQADSR